MHLCKDIQLLQFRYEFDVEILVEAPAPYTSRESQSLSINLPTHNLIYLAPFAAKSSSFYRRQTVNDCTGPPSRSPSPSFACQRLRQVFCLPLHEYRRHNAPFRTLFTDSLISWTGRLRNRFMGTLPFSQAHLSPIRNVELYGWQKYRSQGDFLAIGMGL